MLYDLIIIGTGPAGATAGVYASRYNLKNLIIGKDIGGLIATAHLVCNWPGIPGISGMELGENILKHAEKEGSAIKYNTVNNITKWTDGIFTITLPNGETEQSKALLIAAGTSHRKLNIPGEKEFFGKGVSYCYTCDGMFFRGKTVTVVGGGNSAALAVTYLSDICEHVYMIYRRDRLRCEDVWCDQISAKPNVDILYNTNITQANGANSLEWLTLDTPFKGQNEIKTDGLFIEIGSAPITSFMRQLNVELDDKEYIKVDSAGKTNIEGVWAAGDITTGSNWFRQAITASAEGAICAHNIQQWVKQKD